MTLVSGCLSDTNVLLRFAQRSHPLNTTTRNALRKMKQNGFTLCTTPQNCTEGWNVMTRPLSKNGFGQSQEEARRFLRLVDKVFRVLPDDAQVFPAWRSIVQTVGVSGVQVHDARLVAFMQVYGVSHILTFNTKDFVRYESYAGITVVDPAAV